MDEFWLSIVLGVLSGLVVGWDTGLIHRWDLAGCLLQLATFVGCAALWRVVLEVAEGVEDLGKVAEGPLVVVEAEETGA